MAFVIFMFKVRKLPVNENMTHLNHRQERLALLLLNLFSRARAPQEQEIPVMWRLRQAAGSETHL